MKAKAGFFHDERGQAYSAFKLLIAAIIAMAILAILMPIIAQVMGILTVDPTDAARGLVSDLIGKPGTPGKTDTVTFGSGSALTSSALAEKTSLSTSDFCMSLGENNARNRGFAEDLDNGFELITQPNHRIIWHGIQNQSAKINVVCNSGTLLSEDLAAYGLEEPSPCDCFNQTSTCCAIILERSA